MKAITITVLMLALVLGVAAAWSTAPEPAPTRAQYAKDIFMNKRAVLALQHKMITDRKADCCRKADAVRATRTETAKEACAEKCEKLASQGCPYQYKAKMMQGAREKAQAHQQVPRP
jgi:hypothetical protein